MMSIMKIILAASLIFFCSTSAMAFDTASDEFLESIQGQPAPDKKTFSQDRFNEMDAREKELSKRYEHNAPVEQSHTSPVVVEDLSPSEKTMAFGAFLELLTNTALQAQPQNTQPPQSNPGSIPDLK